MAHNFKFPSASLDYRISVAVDSVAGAYAVSNHGERTAIPTGVVSDIWSNTGSLLQELLHSPERMSVVSTSDSDSVDGVGAEFIIIEGLDGDYNVLQEQVTLEGINPVLTSNLFLRINSSRVYSNNRGGNLGTITVTSDVTSKLQDVIEVGENLSSGTHYCIPNGSTGVITGISARCLKDQEGKIELLTKDLYTSGSVFLPQLHFPVSDVPLNLTDVAYKVPEKTDLKFRFEALSDNVSIYIAYTMYVISN